MRPLAPRLLASPLSSAMGLALIAPLLLLSACNASEPQAQQSAALVGGQTAAPGQFPATVKFEVGCTASKVGPRKFLLAAHCLLDPFSAKLVYPYNQPRVNLRIYHRAVEDYAQGISVEVVDARVHPSWLEGCEKGIEETPEGEYPNCGRPYPAADVALITLARDTPEIPSATVDARPLALAEKLVIMGFGCELDEDGQHAISGRLKYAPTEVIAPIDWAGEPLDLTDPNFSWRPDWLFASRGHLLGAASGCAGDSGGPVVRDDGQNLTVVGVNAHYFSTVVDGAESSYATYHARLSDEHGVASWLEEQGVTVSRGEPTPPSPR